MRPPTPHPAVVFACIFAVVFLLHIPLLQLPYFWDEAGYYIPAARDLLLTGSLIPHTSVSNAHPPLVMAWLALCWKLVGYAPVVTRAAMLMIAAFSLTGFFRLAQHAANTQVAIAATLCTALYPVFFAQSSLAHVDLAAAGFTFWAVWAYLEGRPIATAIFFSLATLAKETAILAPIALAFYEGGRAALCRLNLGDSYQGTPSGVPKVTKGKNAFRRWMSTIASDRPPSLATFIALLAPILPLVLWYAYHYLHTGYVFGNPEFFRYNVAATMSPLRILLALCLRLWQVLAYMHLWVLTFAMFLAMLLPPVKDGNTQRERIPIPVQLVLLVVIAAYVVAMAVIGGAVLARYMLPVVPLVILLAVSTLRRRLRYWPAAIVFMAAALVSAWFWNPPYEFAPEDNLAYRDYIVLHQHAEQFLEARYPMAHVLTAWPASDELARPWLGYITRPVQVVRIEDFSLDEVLSAADFRNNFEVAFVFSTKYEPPGSLLVHWRKWQELKRRYFGYHIDLPPAAAARILGGHIVFAEQRKGQWAAVIELDRDEILNARSYGLMPE